VGALPEVVPLGQLEMAETFGTSSEVFIAK
jgi:hypothetical protein